MFFSQKAIYLNEYLSIVVPVGKHGGKKKSMTVLLPKVYGVLLCFTSILTGRGLAARAKPFCSTSTLTPWLAVKYRATERNRTQRLKAASKQTVSRSRRHDVVETTALKREVLHVPPAAP